MNKMPICALVVTVLINGCSSDFWFGKPSGYIYGSNGAVYYVEDTRKCATNKIYPDNTARCYDSDNNETILYPLSQQQLNFMQSQQQQSYQAPQQRRSLGVQNCYVVNPVTGATSCYSY